MQHRGKGMTSHRWGHDNPAEGEGHVATGGRGAVRCWGLRARTSGRAGLPSASIGQAQREGGDECGGSFKRILN